MRFYGRNVKVVGYVAKMNPENIGAFRPLFDFFHFESNALEIADARVQFQIEKSVGTEPNTCNITISNLNKASRAFFEQSPVHVRIEAGYDGEYRHLFNGDVRFGYSKRPRTDWETHLLLGDGDRAFRAARVNRTFKKGTTVRDALNACAVTMGLVLPDNINARGELDQQFASGVSLSGPTRDELTRLLAPFGYDWSIQNGALQVLKDDDVDDSQAILIAQETGMIGVPEFGSPQKKGGGKNHKKARATMTVQTLLYPQINPGGRVQVRSSEINGLYRVNRVTHKGDSMGQEWTTEVEAFPL